MSSINKTGMSRNSPKPITTKDIANLYSHLQTMIEHIPPSPTHPHSPTLPHSPRFPHSPLLSNFPITPSTSTPLKPTDCPCHHILLSDDSDYCALCDHRIPHLTKLHQTLSHQTQTIQQLQSKIQSLQAEQTQYQTRLSSLQQTTHQAQTDTHQTLQAHERLTQDLQLLQLKLSQERQTSSDLRQEKSRIESELEELSQRLFEEANGMVAQEKKEKSILQERCKILEQELEKSKAQLKTEELELKELKGKMEGLSIETAVETQADTIDPIIFREFKEFVTLNKKSNYLKNSLEEDIEPCLRFPRLSTKKLCEAISINSCFIEERPIGFVQDVPIKISASQQGLWKRLSNTPVIPFFGCQACGRETKDLPFRFRVSDLDDWACIDQYCRDRLVSVCEFYIFLRNIKQGYYSGRSLPDLFQESLSLKLQMFYARMGISYKTIINSNKKSNLIEFTLKY